MPLQQLCSAASNKRGTSSNTPFIVPALYTQELYDAKLSHQPMEKCDSETSTLSYSRDICRICHCEGDSEASLIAPCYCSGSLRYVHQACLQQWIKSSDTKCCELCKFPFIMHSKLKPFQKWQCLEMNGVEKRKVIFSVLFHIIAITCVIWSLYVLIERTSQEVQNGELEWPFWTKLIVVAIGFTGSIVFMYVQCRMYLHLCRRWRAFNRIIYIKNSPEKMIVNDVENSSRVGVEADKPFLHLAVISNNANAITIKSGGGGSCGSTASTPPGALWGEETSALTYPHSSYVHESGNVDLGDENDSLISRTRSVSVPSLHGPSEGVWRKEIPSRKSSSFLPEVHNTSSEEGRTSDQLSSRDSSARDLEDYCFHILNP